MHLQSDPDVQLLWRAAQHGSVPHITKLLQGGVDVNKATRMNGDTALHIAVAYGQVKATREIIAHPSCNPNISSPLGGAPLHLAAHSGNLAIIALLLRHDDINVNIEMWGEKGGNYTPLMLAVQQGNTLAVDLLLRRPDIKPNVMNTMGFTALHMAAYIQRADVAKSLLRHKGIDKDLRLAPAMCSALEVAIHMKSYGVVDLLTDSASPDASAEPPRRGCGSVEGSERKPVLLTLTLVVAPTGGMAVCSRLLVVQPCSLPAQPCKRPDRPAKGQSHQDWQSSLGFLEPFPDNGAPSGPRGAV